MKTLILVLTLTLLLPVAVFATSGCLESAKVKKPNLSANTAGLYKANLVLAEVAILKDKNNADAIIWLGRRNAYLGNYKKAIKIYADGMKKHPNDARFYRHRGHRFISIRCFDDAISDFRKAVKLIEGKPDVVEPDGLPNARNIPTSTLQSNIWYHLGLAYYLKGEFKKAAEAYREGLLVSKNPDMLVAMTNWRYIAVRRSKGKVAAEKEVSRIADDLDIIENEAYYKLVKVYQGKLNADKLLKEISSDANNLSNASLGYGLGNWFLMNGGKEKAFEIFRLITGGDQWSSFGYIAAEAELNRQKNARK
ncbi:MAG: tetratricopeptide repeat protein [Pyrinomonadaceae bacterium]|nr:tetratricopeptide repeat protein [Pyrinomonadaceae bacterium]